jgi:hypothetical protein
MIVVRFESAAAPGESFPVTRCRGEESLSACPRYTIDVTATRPDLPLDAVVGARACLRLGGRTIEGVVTEIEQHGEAAGGSFHYTLVLAPRLALLSLGRESRVFQDISVPDAVVAILDDCGLGLEVDTRLARTYPRRRWLVQHDESPFHFVSRLLENEGIAYHLEGDRLVLCDHNGAYSAPAADDRGTPVPPIAVSALSCRTRLGPRSVLVHDQTDGAHVEASAEVDGRGHGLVAEWGLDGAEDAEARARLRAEELRAAQTVFRAESSSPWLAAGRRLAVAGHFRRDFDGHYLVTRVVHELDGGSYRARFDAIAATTTFRPARTTAKPRAASVMRGRVATAGDGRRHMVVPFDLGGTSGNDPGPMSEPSVRGAEGDVLWSGLDGDLDRPVVITALGSTETPPRGPAVHRVGMPSGGFFEISGGDAAPCQDIAPQSRLEPPRHYATGYTTESDTAFSSANWMRFAVPHDASNWTYLRIGEKAATAATSTATTATGGHATFTEEAASGDTVQNLYDPTANGAPEPRDYEVGAVKTAWAWGLDGVFDYTDKNRTVITKGNKEEIIYGKNRLSIMSGTNELWDAGMLWDLQFRNTGEFFGIPEWRKIEIAHVSSTSIKVGDTEDVFAGFKADASLAGTASVFLGGKVSATAAISLDAWTGFGITLGLGDKYEFTKGDNIRTTAGEELKAKEEILLHVVPSDTHSATGGLIIGGLLVGAGIATSALAAVDNTEAGDWAALGLGSLTYLSAMVAALVMAVKSNAGTPGDPRIHVKNKGGEKYVQLVNGDSKIVMMPDYVELACGTAKLVLNKTGTVTVEAPANFGFGVKGKTWLNDVNFEGQLTGVTQAALGVPAVPRFVPPVLPPLPPLPRVRIHL